MSKKRINGSDGNDGAKSKKRRTEQPENVNDSAIDKKAKPKKTANANGEVAHVLPVPASSTKLGSNLNKKVFAVFSIILNKQIELKHVNELVSLIKDEQNVDVRNATTAYILKRLCRCAGSDNKQSAALATTYLYSILLLAPDVDALEVINIVKKDLPFGQLSSKEESLAAVAHILVAHCIIHAPCFENPKPNLIIGIYQLLLAQLKGRQYHIYMSAVKIVETFKVLSEENFRQHAWPLLQPVLVKPFEKKQFEICDLIIAVHLSYPTVMNRKQLEQFMWRDKKPQYEQLFDFYLTTNPANNASYDVYERLAKLLTSKKTLLPLWQQRIAETSLEQSIPKSCALKVLSYLMVCYQEKPNASEDQSPIVELFNSKFVNMLSNELITAKKIQAKEKYTKLKSSEQNMLAICEGFEYALQVYFQQPNSGKLAILNRLLDSNVHTSCTQQLINQLDSEELKLLYQTYKDKLTNENDELITNVVRDQCLTSMKNILLNAKLKHESAWRNQEMEFLLLGALFHLDANKQVCTASEAAKYSKQLSKRFEDTFFIALLHKSGVNDLSELSKTLQHHLKMLTKQLKGGKAQEKLRAPCTEEAQSVWKQVKESLKSSSKNQDPVSLACDVLIYFVALWMHTNGNQESAELLQDLCICKQCASDEQAGLPNKQAEQLPWRDVLITALLQLLLQNELFWRELVNVIAAAVAKHLKKESIAEVLQVLDMTQNPLGTKDDKQQAGEPNDHDDADNQTMQSDEGSNSDESDDGDSNSSSNEESSEDEDEDEEEGDDEDENFTQQRLDEVRESVRKALASDIQADDDDAVSIDWNDVDEEAGERLNAALELSFKNFRPKQKSRNKKSTKAERIQSTTLLHFRIRVLDLLDVFVTQQPQMELLLDTLWTVFNVYQFSCNDKKLKPLGIASLKLLRKLLAHKVFYEQTDKAAMCATIEQFAKYQSKQLEANNQWRDKCMAYLIRQFGGKDIVDIWSILNKYLDAYLQNKHSKHSLYIFELLLLTKWQGVAELAALLASKLSLASTRSNQRKQILELLFKERRNITLALADDKKAAKHCKQNIDIYVKELLQSSDDCKGMWFKKFAKLVQSLGLVNDNWTNLCKQKNVKVAATQETNNAMKKSVKSAKSHDEDLTIDGKDDLNSLKPGKTNKKNKQVSTNNDDATETTVGAKKLKLKNGSVAKPSKTKTKKIN